MDHVEIGKTYRHFKGNYYFVENVALDSENKQRMVVYKPLYDRKDSMIWVRPEKMFLEEISELEKTWSFNSEVQPYSVFIYFNTTKPPFTNAKIRRAFALAINRQELLGILGKGCKKATTAPGRPAEWPPAGRGLSAGKCCRDSSPR